MSLSVAKWALCRRRASITTGEAARHLQKDQGWRGFVPVQALACFSSRASATVQSPSGPRQADPSICRSACGSGTTCALNDRQILSFLEKGAAVAMKLPFAPDRGLSHATLAPFPCGSSATASAAFARRQSSPSSSLDKTTVDRLIDPVGLWSAMNPPIGNETEQALAQMPMPLHIRSRRMARDAKPRPAALGSIRTADIAEAFAFEIGCLTFTSAIRFSATT